MKYVLRPVVIIAVAGVAAAALVFAGSGMAVVGTPLPQTLTDNFHGTQSVVALNQCTNTLVDLTEKTNILFHITSFPTSGDVHVTSTEEDSFSGVDETSGVTYMGHVLFWGTFNLNNQNSNSTFTTAIHATGSNGSTVSIHDVGHVTLLPEANVSVSFDKPSLTCTF